MIEVIIWTFLFMFVFLPLFGLWASGGEGFSDYSKWFKEFTFKREKDYIESIVDKIRFRKVFKRLFTYIILTGWLLMTLIFGSALSGYIWILIFKPLKMIFIEGDDND